MALPAKSYLQTGKVNPERKGVHAMKRLVSVALVVLAFFAQAGSGAEEKRVEVRTTLRRLALFKNGLGFFIREGKLPGRAGPIVIEPLPVPAHGTFWVSYAKEAGLRDLRAARSKRGQRADAATIAELLSVNAGKQVVIWLSDSAEAVIKGVLLAARTEAAATSPGPYEGGYAAAPSYPYRPAPPRGPLVLVRTSSGVTAVEPGTIRRVDILSNEVEREVEQQTEAAALRASLEKAAGGSIAVSYLAKGVTWAPSYIVDISDPKMARISAKAIVMNEVEDLDGVHLDLISGFPNLMYSDIISPIAMKQDIAQFLQSLMRGVTEPRRGADVMSQVAYQRAAFPAEEGRFAGIVPAYSTAAVGERAEDLFLYPLEKVRLAKGEVGYYGLFTEPTPYRHVYQWEIPDYVSEEDVYGQPRREEREKPEEVWHCLRLKNTTKIPWTTAPAETVEKDQILGQDILRYTNPGGETVLKITQALGVKAQQRELETERQREALKLYGYVYDRVTIRGELAVRNFKDEKIHMEISKTFSGELKASDPKAEMTQLARGLKRVNPVNLLKWEPDIAAGASQNITYTYTVLVRR